MLNIGDTVQIKGCSTKKRILETSSGCSSFDTLCGGSLTNSSIIHIDEPKSRYYSSFLVRYFIAEGIEHSHNCFIVDPNNDATTGLCTSIPSRKQQIEDERPSAPSPMEPEMKIAWRYDKVAKVDSAIGSSSKNDSVYDFTKPLSRVDCEVYQPEKYSYTELYRRIVEIVRIDEKHTKSTGRGGPKKNLLRIIIQNIDSPLWSDPENLPKFMVLLQSLLRSSYAIAYITSNSFSIQESTLRILESSADVCIKLVCFNEEEKKTFRHLGNAQGYFHLLNLPRLSSLGTHCPPIVDLIFEASSNKGFQIRIMHLPPALEESSNSTPCKIDF